MGDKKKSMTERLMDPREVPNVLHEGATKLRSKWRKVVTGDEKKRIRDRFKETQGEPKYVKFFDKLAFTIGVLNMGVCQYFLLNRPDLFPAWYAIIIPVILGSRYFYFKGGGMQYFMIDFCYFTIFCSLVNLLVVTDSERLFKVCYVCCTGPLTLAIPVWRNSFVFHDYDKIVSVYIHILPSMLYYTLRHKNSRLNVFAATDTCHLDNCSDLRISDYFIALCLYMFWQFAYLLKTEFLDKDRLDQHPELLTSLRWMAKDTKNAFARMFLNLFRRLRVFRRDEEFDARSLKTKSVFVFAQLLFTLVAFLPTPFMYHSGTFHLAYILLIITSSVFNGASFYIEVFSKRYQNHIVKIEEMHQIAKAARDAISDLNNRKESSSAKGSSQALAASPTPRSPARPRSSEGGEFFGAERESLNVVDPSVLAAAAVDQVELEEQQAAADAQDDQSVAKLSKLTALLQKTSDSAWLEMKELVRTADEMRGIYSERLSDDIMGDPDISPEGDDYVVCKSFGGWGGSDDTADDHVNNNDHLDEELDDEDENGLSSLERRRNNSVLSIDR